MGEIADQMIWAEMMGFEDPSDPEAIVAYYDQPGPDAALGMDAMFMLSELEQLKDQASAAVTAVFPDVSAEDAEVFVRVLLLMQAKAPQ